MDRRLALHRQLTDIFTEATGLSAKGHVFFQPTSDTTLSYPCILYKLRDIDKRNANNRFYTINHSYELTVIDRDPLSPLREAIVRLPMCSLNRIYEADNLHHYVFTIYD